MTTTRIVVWSIGLLFLLAGEARAAERARVLMLHAFNYSFPATSGSRRPLESGWSSTRNQLRSMRNFSTSARNTDEAHSLQVATFIRDKYGKHPPNLVITLGSNALPFVIKYRDISQCSGRLCIHLATDLCCAAPPPEMTGIITAFDLSKTLSLAERLQPEARRLFVIAGSGETDRRWQPLARKMIEERGGKFETTFLFELPYSELVTELSKVPKDAIVILLTVFADAEGKTFVPAQVAADLSALSPAPIYGPYDTFVGGVPSAALLRRSNRSALRRPKWRSKSWMARIRPRSRPELIPRSTTGLITGQCNAGI